ncbi:MAG TPA: DUF2177 family protein [Caulobacteraceae bacterium]|jgi:uncharacterized membrane protein
MIRSAVAYAGAGLVFAGLDAAWLTLTNAALYRPILGPLLADRVRLVPAVLFYALYLLGVVGFAAMPAVRAGRWQNAVKLGAAFGFVAYATYDLTNQATLRAWSTEITVLDLSWGTFVSACGAAAGYFAVKAAGLSLPAPLTASRAAPRTSP